MGDFPKLSRDAEDALSHYLLQKTLRVESFQNLIYFRAQALCRSSNRHNCNDRILNLLGQL